MKMILDIHGDYLILSEIDRGSALSIEANEDCRGKQPVYLELNRAQVLELQDAIGQFLAGKRLEEN